MDQSQVRQKQRAVLRIDVLTGDTFLGGETISLSPSEAAVLIALRINGGALHRDIFAAELYGDGDHRNAVNALKVAVYRLRQRTGRHDVIERRAGGYALGDSVSVEIPALIGTSDACSCDPREWHDLERLRARLRVGRPGFMLAWPWFDETERRLRELEHDVTMMLALLAFRSARYGDALALAEDLMRTDPLDDDAVRLVLRSYVALGQAELALVHYRRYASRLRQEAGETSEVTLSEILMSESVTPSGGR